jgi:hypothetical protein
LSVGKRLEMIDFFSFHFYGTQRKILNEKAF